MTSRKSRICRLRVATCGDSSAGWPPKVGTGTHVSGATDNQMTNLGLGLRPQHYLCGNIWEMTAVVLSLHIRENGILISLFVKP
jgi:hypothetical protein